MSAAAGRPAARLRDGAVTALLWSWYIGGWLFWFSPRYLAALCRRGDREAAFQRLNHRLHRRFFEWLARLAPRTAWRIAPEVRALRGCVIVANHLSFLDPILFVSLFERQKTIVKGAYFRLPVFGWILKTSGYIAPLGEGPDAAALVDQIKGLGDYLAAGGNLFVFPEGTRSRSGRLAPFDRGAFKIARLCRAPSLAVVQIRNTQRLFPPDRILFRTGEPLAIEVTLAGRLAPDYGTAAGTPEALAAAARALLAQEV